LGPRLPAAAPPASTTVGGFWRLRLAAPRALTLRPLLRGRWNDPRQAARPAATHGLISRVRLLIFDPFFELGQPLLHRSLDLGPGRARFFGPDPRAVRSDRFWGRIRIGRLVINRYFRREFRHLRQC
jgi:hypothetical protein